MLFDYDFVEAKDEQDLKFKLNTLTRVSGFTYKIINVYRKGNSVIAWYYSKRK